ncbi:tyrosine-protein phosphatase MSG5 [Entomortierella parvispora]|uniref:protein-tyrosine-phosphatase n=1 Tax=Entomortierella parvispora TaxID=205924 RepID=A0A9P3LSL0_9FUNG|nr:tyrosine-protein phosphatase MSG5 [Entomortierella parvispora]
MPSTVTSSPAEPLLSSSPSQLSQSQPMLPSPATSDSTSTSILGPLPTLGMRPTSHSFSLQRPLLAEDVKRTRNSKRLSLLVPPSPGKIETLATIAAAANSPSFPQPATPSFTSAMPSIPSRRRTMAISAPISLPAASSENTTRRQSQLWLDQALPSPRIPLSSSTSEFQQQQRRRPISAYFADFSVECGAASPYTTQPVSVLPHLYLGAEHNAMDTTVLGQLGITGVLNVAVEIAQESAATGSTLSVKEIPSDSRRKDTSGDNPCHWKQGIQYKSLAWSHHQRNLLEEFPEAFEFIDRIRTEGGKVLVHCQLGVSRSASLVIAYVMQSRNMGLNEAYDFVKARSAVISPNMGLMYQLAEFEKAQKSSESGTVSGARRDGKNGDQDANTDEEAYPYPTDMDTDSSYDQQQSLARMADTHAVDMVPPTPVATTFSLSSTTLHPLAMSSNGPTRVATRPRSSLSRSILVPVPQDILKSSAKDESLSVSTTGLASELTLDSPMNESPTTLSPPAPLFFSEGVSSLSPSNSPSSTCSLSSFTTSNYSRPSSTSSIASVMTVPTACGGSGPGSGGASAAGVPTKNVTKLIVISPMVGKLYPTTQPPEQGMAIAANQGSVVTPLPLTATEAPSAIAAPQPLRSHRPSLPEMVSPQAQAKRMSLHRAHTSTVPTTLTSGPHQRPLPQHPQQLQQLQQNTHALPSLSASPPTLPPTRSHTLATVLTRPWSSFHNTHLSQQDSLQTQPALQHYPLHARQSSSNSTMMASHVMNHTQDSAAGVGGTLLVPSASSPTRLPQPSPFGSSRIRAVTVDGSESFGGMGDTALRGSYSAEQDPSESIFSPRPFSPPPPSLLAAAATTTVDQVSALTNRNRSFAGFYQSLRMEG